MAPPYNPVNTRVRVSTTSGGTYTSVGYVRSFDMNEGTENDVRLKYFGGEFVTPGDATLTASMPVVWDRGDTTGQKVLRDAKRAGTAVWLQFCPEGTTAGLKCDQFQAYITEMSATSDADAEAVEGSFGFRGVASTLTEVTLA